MSHDVIVIGGSAGALPALTTIVRALPLALPASVFVVTHARADSNGVLPQILGRATPLPVEFASHHAPLRHGRIYVARPDFHLLLDDRAMLVMRGPRENGFRPAIDPLFRTAARHHGPRVIAVILSGALDDGTYGMSLVRHHGGVTIAQDPQDAVIPSMPSSVLRQVGVDYVRPAADIGALLVELTRAPAPAVAQGSEVMAHDADPEPQVPEDQMPVHEMQERFGPPSALTCPDCGGALWEIKGGDLTRYRCHVGHQFAADSLAAGQRDAVEGALWSAVRVLEEHAELRLRMARRAEGAGLATVAEGFAEGAHHAHRQADAIRALLFNASQAPESLEAEAATPAPARPARGGRRATGR